MKDTCPSSCTFTEKSGQYAVRNLLERVRARLNDWDIAEPMCMSVESALSEALNNVIEHAYRFEDGHPLSVTLRKESTCLNSTIIDEGAPIPGLRAPNPNQPDVDVALEDLPEGGFGWFMINALADDVRYERRDSRNILTIRLPVV